MQKKGDEEEEENKSIMCMSFIQIYGTGVEFDLKLQLINLLWSDPVIFLFNDIKIDNFASR